jgi:aromatic-L-amino-acid/L-tryptophan decarboxylase
MTSFAGTTRGSSTPDYRARARADLRRLVAAQSSPPRIPPMDAATFRRLGHQLIDWVADYRENLAALPVRSSVKPGEIRARFGKEPPQKGGRIGEVPELLNSVLPGITHWNHPSFFAYFPSNTGYASILADVVASGLGSQGMSWETSPAATEVEEVVMDWLGQMLGLPRDFEGVIHDTASTATLCALLCARERTLGSRAGGLQQAGPALRVYASAEAHSSIDKAVRLAGFGREHLRLVPTDDEHAMLPGVLAEMVGADAAAGLRPCAVVATIGSTATTAVDPLAKVAEISALASAWLHVDAAMAGTAMVLPECRKLWQGIERADSLVMNPHKWMGVGFDFSAYYVRDVQHLVRVMGTNPSYLRTARDAEVKNLRDWGIPLGRRFRALKLLFFLMDTGVEGLQARLRRDLANAQWLREQVDRAPDWQRLAPVPLQTLCIRHRPKGRDEAALTQHNLAIAACINGSGKAYLTPSLLKGVQMLRVSIGAERTERAHVQALWQSLQEAARSV